MPSSPTTSKDATAVLEATQGLSTAPLGNVQQCPASGCMDRTSAVQHLDTNAQAASTGKCARFVREAIEAGGVELDPSTRPVSAKNYGPYLVQHGFVAIDQGANFVPEKGDVMVIDGFEDVKDDKGAVKYKGSAHGHIQMWNGSQWVSDFSQGTGTYPGPGYRAAKPSTQVYRAP